MLEYSSAVLAPGGEDYEGLLDTSSPPQRHRDSFRKSSLCTQQRCKHYSLVVLGLYDNSLLRVRCAAVMHGSEPDSEQPA